VVCAVLDDLRETEANRCVNLPAVPTLHHVGVGVDLFREQLDPVLERVALEGELTAALDRPRSTATHDTGVLVNAGLLRVLRPRRVRARLAGDSGPPRS
jgi:hypothetical protein